MPRGRFFKGLVGLLLLPPLLAILGIALFGWNWTRAPLQRLTFEKTGRQLVIGGDLTLKLAWPAPRITARQVSFANPPWAKESQMVAVEEVELSVDLPELLRMNLAFPEVRLTRPTVFLEKAVDGRKNWLLDRDQSDETARIPIGRLTLDRGKLGYDDAGLRTSVRAEISTRDGQEDPPEDTGVVFSAMGLYHGLALVAHGSGGSVLALQDETLPYPLSVEATIGRTAIKAAGTVTSLSRISAMDMQLALRGDSLALLYPLLGIAFPETHRYAMAGHMLHSGSSWRYEKFSGHMGNSDLAGSLELESGGARPFLRGELVSERLDFADLGPLVGIRGRPKASTASTRERLLPDTAFKTERWNSVDADVSLKATSVLRARQLPLDNLRARLTLHDALLTLDPLDVGVAGGHLTAVVSLDGRHNPIQASAGIGARNIHLARLFPARKHTKTNIGRINGELELTGAGNSVARMLAKSDGRISLIVANGVVSRLLMEKISLHLLEILQLTVLGDKTVRLHCAVADFGVKAGFMRPNVLILDTDVSSIIGKGGIDLDRETLDLTFVPKTKSTSPVALRTPIHVGGTFAHPAVDLDKGRIAARGAGALALGLLNPLLVLIPLVEMGPGIDSDCGRLIHSAQKPMRKDAVVK